MARLKSPAPRLRLDRGERVRMPHGAAEVQAHRDRQHWRAWYKTSRWQALRLTVLIRDRFTCGMCGRVSGAKGVLVADHRIAHRGDAKLFWDEANLWTLCKSPCHDQVKQREEQGRR